MQIKHITCFTHGDITPVRAACKRYSRMRSYPEPDWVEDADSRKIEHLLNTLNENNEPIVTPDAIGDWGLKMG